MKFSTLSTRVLIVLCAILFDCVFSCQNEKNPPQENGGICIKFAYTGVSVLDSFFTRRMTMMYIAITNARNNSNESNVPISAQAS